MLRVLEQARPLVIGLSPWDLNAMEERVRASIRATPGAVEFELAPGSHSAKNAPKVISAFEIAMLDLQGQIVGAPVADLLGGAVRDAVPYSAYLFFKYAEHVDKPYAPDAWGEGISPEQIVAQARRMIERYGFKSSAAASATATTCRRCGATTRPSRARHPGSDPRCQRGAARLAR